MFIDKHELVETQDFLSDKHKSVELKWWLK